MAGQFIQMDPLYITGTVPKPNVEIVKLTESPLPWLVGAGVLGIGIVAVAFSRSRRRRKRR